MTPCEQTDACENIAFPQLFFRAVNIGRCCNNIALVLSSLWSHWYPCFKARVDSLTCVLHCLYVNFFKYSVNLITLSKKTKQTSLVLNHFIHKLLISSFIIFNNWATNLNNRATNLNNQHLCEYITPETKFTSNTSIWKTSDCAAVLLSLESILLVKTQRILP